MEVESIHRAMKKKWLPGLALLALISFLGTFGSFFSMFRHPVWYLTDSSGLFSCIFLLCILVTPLVELCFYFSWRRRAKEAALRGIRLPAKEHRLFSIVSLCLVGVLLALDLGCDAGSYGPRAAIGMIVFDVAALLLPILAAGRIREYLRSKKAGAGINRAAAITGFVLVYLAVVIAGGGLLVKSIGAGTKKYAVETYKYDENTFYVYHDELPLALKDLFPSVKDGYSAKLEVKKSFLAAQYTGTQEKRLDMRGGPEISYTVTEVKLPGLYDLCRKDLFRNQDETDDKRVPEEYKQIYKVQEAKPWQAKEAYRLYSKQFKTYENRYLLCFEDRIVELWLNWEPTEEQMKTITERLLTNI